MQWLLHGSIDASVSNALRGRDDKTHDLSAVGISPEAEIGEIVQAAISRQFDLITDDPKLIQMVYDQHIKFGRSIVLIQVKGEVEQDDAIDRLFKRYKRLTPGRLYTVTGSRVKVRQLPTG